MGQSDEALAPEKRIAYFRGMAAEALRLAQAATDDSQKANYLDIAGRWNLLAAEAERRLMRETENGERNGSSQAQSDGDRH